MSDPTCLKSETFKSISPRDQQLNYHLVFRFDDLQLFRRPQNEQRKFEQQVKQDQQLLTRSCGVDSTRNGVHRSISSGYGRLNERSLSSLCSVSSSGQSSSVYDEQRRNTAESRGAAVVGGVSAGDNKQQLTAGRNASIVAKTSNTTGIDINNNDNNTCTERRYNEREPSVIVDYNSDNIYKELFAIGNLVWLLYTLLIPFRSPQQNVVVDVDQYEPEIKYILWRRFYHHSAGAAAWADVWRPRPLAATPTHAAQPQACAQQQAY